METLEAAAVWSDWGRLTRFLESARLACARERNLWTSLELASADKVKLSAPTGQGANEVSLAMHLAAVQDEDTFYGSVLIHTYALAETAARERLSADLRDFGGIEDWGTRLLETTGATWEALKGGRAGVVEAAVVRNAYAHGTRRIDPSGVKRLRAAGTEHPGEGDLVTLDYATLKLFRTRLKKLLGLGGIGHEG